MSYYQRHIFFCINERKGDDRPSCAHQNAEAMQTHAKQCAKRLGIAGPGAVRVNKSGCLDRCEQGPVAVVYPDGVWYTYVDESDVEEIVTSHLKDGQVVTRLLIDPQ